GSCPWRGLRDCARWARKISSLISACTVPSIGGTGLNGLPTSTPCSLPCRSTVLSASPERPKQGAPGAPSPRLCCFVGSFYRRLYLLHCPGPWGRAPRCAGLKRLH